MPLSDLGSSRVVDFNALKIEWHIEFKSTEIMSAIGEEFVSFLQVVLCEIAAENQGILLAGHKVDNLDSRGPFPKGNYSRWQVDFDNSDL